jgi:hypothetical protein
MLTAVGRDLVASPVFTQVAGRADQEERAKLAGQILIVLRWVDHPVHREVVGLEENRAKVELEVTMAALVIKTVRSTRPLRVIVGIPLRAAAIPRWNPRLRCNTALHGTGCGSTVIIFWTESILTINGTSTRIMPVAQQC